jgi:hypothetical protein
VRRTRSIHSDRHWTVGHCPWTNHCSGVPRARWRTMHFPTLSTITRHHLGWRMRKVIGTTYSVWRWSKLLSRSWSLSHEMEAEPRVASRSGKGCLIYFTLLVTQAGPNVAIVCKKLSCSTRGWHWHFLAVLLQTHGGGGTQCPVNLILLGTLAPWSVIASAVGRRRGVCFEIVH